jgi:hypothetical protein
MYALELYLRFDSQNKGSVKCAVFFIFMQIYIQVLNVNLKLKIVPNFVPRYSQVLLYYSNQ